MKDYVEVMWGKQAFNTQPFKMLSHTLLAAVRLSACNLQWANKGSATSYKKKEEKKL